MRVFRSVVLSVILLVSLAAQSQSVSSVYSNNGIGLLNYQGLPHNLGMGEIGIGVPSLWNMNYQNPAFLPLNSVTMFQVGLEIDSRNIASSSAKGKKVAGGLRYMNLSMPIINGKWTTTLGITPYSTVNTKTFSLGTIDGDVPTATTFEGSGGITAFQWSNGFRVGKGIYAGVRSSFLFGAIEDLESTVINDEAGSYSVDFTDRSSYSGFELDLSFGYRKTLDNSRVLNFGLIYEMGNSLSGSQDQAMKTTILPDRIILKNEAINFSLPSSIGFGSSYQVLNKWTVGADVQYTNWSNAGNESDNFQNTLRIAFGAELTPDYMNVNNYYKRVSYRAGVNFGEMPYLVNGKQIKEVGINFGGSLPIGVSSLDWAFKYGQLGTLNNNLVRETYFRIVLGASINDRWFIKRRYD